MNNVNYIEDLYDTQKVNTEKEIAAARDKALSGIGVEEAKIQPLYTGQKQQANVSSQIGAKNFAEYWATRGQNYAGVAAQEQLSRANTLGNTLGGIQKSENQAYQDVANAKIEANTDYTNSLNKAYGDINIAKKGALYDERLRSQAAAEARANARIKAEEDKFIEGSVKTVNGQTQQYMNGKWTNMSYDKDVDGNVIDKKSAEWNKKGYGNTGQFSPVTFTDNKGQTKNYSIWVKDNTPNVIIRGNPIPLVANKQNATELVNYIVELGRTGKITPQQMVELNNSIEYIE